MRRNFPTLVLSVAMLAGMPAGVVLAQSQTDATQGAATATSKMPPADAKPHHAPNPARQAKMMAKRLGLSADQTGKIEPILADRHQQMESVRGDNSLAPKDRHAKVKEIKQDSDQKIEAILNDTQKQQYEQMKQDRKAHRSQNLPPSGE